MENSKTNRKPSISVIIPAYNMEQYIKDTLASVLNQTLKDFECIILDDGSTDGTVEIAKNLISNDDRFRIISQKNKGLAAARNAAIKAAKSDLILPLDADDLISENYLESAVKYLNDEDDIPVFFANIVKFYPNGEKQNSSTRWINYKELLKHNAFSCCSAFRKADWERVGGYNEKMAAYEDWEFWIRLLFNNCYGLEQNRDATFFYRQRSGSLRLWGEKNHNLLIRKIGEYNRKIYKTVLDENYYPIVTETKKDDEILVVIPYLKRDAQGDELKMAISGWIKHFNENFRIAVIGDCEPYLAYFGDKVDFIECPRVDEIEGQYTCHIDHCNKFKKVREYYPDKKGFIYTCDDIYAVNDFSMEDVLFPKINTKEMENTPKLSKWMADQYKTRVYNQSKGYSIKNYVCHLPVYYEFDKLFEIYDELDCSHNSYVVENIYFNKYYPNMEAYLLDNIRDNIRFQSRGNINEYSDMFRLFNKKIWYTNSVAGFDLKLMKQLKEHYNL